MVGRLRLADVYCAALLVESQYLKLIARCRLIFNVSFINVFTQIRKVSYQGVCAILCRSFYVKLAFY